VRLSLIRKVVLTGFGRVIVVQALTVADKDEAWIFHITPDDTGTSAVWVAQRVPDEHITVVANQFIIRKVHKGHPDFIYSSNLWEVAERNGLWAPGEGESRAMVLQGDECYSSWGNEVHQWAVSTGECLRGRSESRLLDLTVTQDSHALIAVRRWGMFLGVPCG
jgi:dipeptidase